MVSFITSSRVVANSGSLLTFGGEELSFLGDPLIVPAANSEGDVPSLRPAPVVNAIARKDGSIMAIPARFPQPWHTGETATPFAITVRNYDGTARDDVASATFTLVNRANNTKLINSQACQSVVGGELAYRPTALEMATACLFVAQFTTTLDTGYVLPTILVEGEIEASL